jgi:hypothetical protein
MPEVLIWAMIPITAIICVVFLPIWTHHQRKMMEMKLKMSEKTDGNLLQELQSLKAQIIDLRDTTTRYDMSFDAALQRLESRMSHIESKQIQPQEEFSRIGHTE